MGHIPYNKSYSKSDFRVNFTGLPSIGWMSPNPKVYMEIRRANESGNFDVIHRTEQQVTRSPSYLGTSFSLTQFTYDFIKLTFLDKN